MDVSRDAEWNRWSPPPLVLGTRVFAWTDWGVVLREAVELQGSAQVTFQRDDTGQEMVFRDSLLAGTTGSLLRVGAGYGIIGLGEKIEHPNLYHQELLYTFAIDGYFRCRLLSQGIISGLSAFGIDYFGSRNEREHQQRIFEYLRALHFWGQLAGYRFNSAEQRREAIPNLRRIANDEALLICKALFRFKAKRYVDYFLPKLEPYSRTR